MTLQTTGGGGGGGGGFEECLISLETVLHRCIEKNLVLN